MPTTDFDIAIIGSGIAGAALGAILARHGQRVVIFEAKSHPRFAIGESLILETSETMRALAELYDVPELAYFSSENFLPFSGTSHGVKRHFGFLHHMPGREHDPRRTLQAVIPQEPHGHELHLYRQDTDYFLASVAIQCGATLWQNTPVAAVDFHDDYAAVTTAQGKTITAAYVVDAGGFRSLLAQKFNLRLHDLQTHSRAIFTHLINVPGFAQVNPAGYDVPFTMAEGTLHHLFPGGWLWVIPFDNHRNATNPLCSVGLMLDPRQHPLAESMSPEEEFFHFISQFPSLARQLAKGSPVRAWTRTGRIQYNSRQVVGDRWALLGHAAGFIDPLYSKGLYIALAAVNQLAHLLLQAADSGDYSARAFQPLETMTCQFIRAGDRLVANSYKSFQHVDLWPVYAVQWLLGAYTELVKLNMMRARFGDDRDAYMAELAQLKLVGGGFPAFDTVTDQVDQIMEVVDPGDKTAVADAVAQIKRIFRAVEWMPDPFLALLEGKTHLPKNKLRLSLLKPGEGFMGQGDYRQHFFGEMNLLDLMQYGIREKVKYAAPVLNWQHRRSV